MSKKLEVIPNHETMRCWKCGGAGYIIEHPSCQEIIDKIKDYGKIEMSEKQMEKLEESLKCDLCNGTGKWIETTYYMIYTDKNGVKNGFVVDSIK